MNPASKVIFLDIDGPLLSHRARRHPKNCSPDFGGGPRPLPEPVDWSALKAPERSEFVRFFDQIAVHLILQLIDGYQARVVISSSWQKAGRANIEFILRENGISGTHLHPYWKTGDSVPGDTRADDILAWLKAANNRGEDISAYAAIDDDLSVGKLPGGIVVPYSDGLRWGDFCSASAALGGGFEVFDIRKSGNKLTGAVSRGRLGELPIYSHGSGGRRFEFLAEKDCGPAPPGCIRLRKSQYQLIRLQDDIGNADVQSLLADQRPASDP